MFFFTNQLLGQSKFEQLEYGWDIFLGRNDDDVAFDVIQDAYNNYHIVGSSESGNNRGSDILYRVCNNKGEIILSKNIGSQKDDVGTNLILDDDNNIVIVGTTVNNPTKSFGGTDIWMIKLNLQGKVIKSSVIGSAKDEAVSNLIYLDDHYYSAGLFDGSSVLLKFSKDLELVSQQAIDSELGEIKDVTFHDGKFYVLSQIDKKEKSKSTLLSYTTDLTRGNTIEFPEEIPNEAIAINRHKNGQLIIGANSYSRRSGANAHIILFDITENKFEVVSEVKGKFNDKAKDVVSLPNGKLVLIGETNSHISNARRSNGFVQVIEGDYTYLSHFGGKQNELVNKVYHSNQNEVLLLGASVSNKSADLDAWLVNLFSDNAESSLSAVDPSQLSVETESIKVYEKYPGDKFIVNLKIKNESNNDLSNITLSIQSTLEEINSNPSYFIRSIERGEKKLLSIPIEIPEDAPISNQKLNIKIAESNQRIFEVPINIIEREYPSVSFSGFNYTILKEDKNQLNVEMSVTNNGNIDMANGTITAFFANNENQIINLPDLKTEETKQIKFELDLDESLYADSSRIRISYLYGDDYYKNEYFNVNIIKEFDRIDNLEMDQLLKSLTKKKLIKIPAKIADFSKKEIEDVKVDEAPITDNPITIKKEVKSQFLPVQSYVWKYPDIDYSGQVIEQTNNQLNLKLIIRSNIELDLEIIDLSINEYLNPIGELYSEEDLSLELVTDQNNEYVYIYKNKLSLLTGENNIKIDISQNETSNNTSFLIDYIPPKKNLHVYAVGIDYSETNYPLIYPGKDAADLADALKSQQKTLFNEVIINLANDKKQTSTIELQKFSRRIKSDYNNGTISEDDFLIFYLSGHGFSDPDEPSALRIASSDYDEFAYDLTSIDYEDGLLKYIEDIPCKKLILLDACHSGSLVSDNSDKGAKNLNLLNEITLSRAIEKLLAIKDKLYVITSSGPDQLSYEDEKWDNSAFMKAILDAFSNTEFDHKGNKSIADNDKDSILMLSELYTYIRKRVPSIIDQNKDKNKSRIQVPLMDIKQLKDDIPLFFYNPR